MNEDKETQLRYSDFTISIIEGCHKYINKRLKEEPDPLRRALILNRVIGNLAIGFYNMNLEFVSKELGKKNELIERKMTEEVLK